MGQDSNKSVRRIINHSYGFLLCMATVPSQAIPCSDWAEQRQKIIRNGVALVGEERVSGVTVEPPPGFLVAQVNGVAGLPDMPSGAALRLIGGRGTLASRNPVVTVESYWPYATTLFDYIRRAMPFSAPGSLSNDDVYAVTAYILAESNIVDKATVINAETLPKVQMPNRDGFIPDPRPELFK
jgi:hypothetical protein